MLFKKGLENIHFVQCWISSRAVLIITEGCPGLLLLFTGSLKGLDLFDEFSLKKGLEDIHFVPCGVSSLALLTIAEGLPGQLLLFTGSPKGLDLVDEFSLWGLWTCRL